MATRSIKTPTAKKVSTRRPVVRSEAKIPSIPEGLDPRVFAYEVKPSLLTQVLHVYRDNAHQDTSKVKTRGELTKTTRKTYKQKGTGNARHGSRMAPIFVGGGVAHGPTGVQPANLKVNRKMKATALAGILSLYAKDKLLELIILPEVTTPKVKTIKSLLPQEGTLLVHHQEGAALISSVKNLSNVTAVEANRLNAYQVAQNKYLALTPAAATAIIARLLPLLKAKTR